MPVRSIHHVEGSLSKFQRHVPMEEIAHGIDKYKFGFSPLQGLFKQLLVQTHDAVEMSFATSVEDGQTCVPGLPHPFEPIAPENGIAMVASGAAARATRQEIPRRFGPLDTRLLGHIMSPIDDHLL